MDSNDQEASEMYRSGAYFEQARQWYKALYIAPIAERSFFLIVVTLAGLIGLIGFFAFVGLMPITARPGILVSNPELEDTVPSIARLRYGDQSVNDALKRYFVVQYVLSREGYTAGTFNTNRLFVTAHSDPSVTEAYAAAVGDQNPRNPAALLGAGGKRMVEILDVSIDPRNDPQSAMVKFSTELGGTVTGSKTQWTATMQFHYSDAVVTETTVPETGEKTASLQEPTFQVVNYALTQN